MLRVEFGVLVINNETGRGERTSQKTRFVKATRGAPCDVKDAQSLFCDGCVGWPERMTRLKGFVVNHGLQKRSMEVNHYTPMLPAAATRTHDRAAATHKRASRANARAACARSSKDDFSSEVVLSIL